MLKPLSIENARASIVTVVRFLAWLDRHDRSMADITQTGLDHYLAGHPGRGEMLVSFIAWTERTLFTSGLKMPKWRRGSPQVVLSAAERRAGVELLLHDHDIRLYCRSG